MRYMNKRIWTFIGLKILEIGGAIGLAFLAYNTNFWFNIVEKNKVCSFVVMKAGTYNDAYLQCNNYLDATLSYVLWFFVGLFCIISVLAIIAFIVGIIIVIYWGVEEWFKLNWKLSGRILK